MAPKNVFLILALVFLCGCEAPIANRNSRGSEIVCFGDSLTAGYGAKKGKDYPSVLREKLGQPVINTGVSGNTTADGLRRLEDDVLRHDPKIDVHEGVRRYVAWMRKVYGMHKA